MENGRLVIIILITLLAIIPTTTISYSIVQCGTPLHLIQMERIMRCMQQDIDSVNLRINQHDSKIIELEQRTLTLERERVLSNSLNLMSEALNGLSE